MCLHAVVYNISMESDDDPLLVKYLISSLEFEKLKYYEAKCHELTVEIEKLKQNNSDQVGGGNYVVKSGLFNSLQTPMLIEKQETEKPLINYSVPIIKNDANDGFDECALLHLVPQEHQLKAKSLLQEIDSRGSELTWNSSGVVFIDRISIPNSNFFIIYPHLFQKAFPKREIPGLKEVINKLKIMGLSHFIGLNSSSNDSDQNPDLTVFMQGAGDQPGIKIEPEAGIKIEPEDSSSKGPQQTTTIASWWFLE